MSTPPFDLEHSLRRHGDGLRQLAAALLRDPNDADDAVQDLWLGVLRAPPRGGEGLVGWFATALGNTARKLHRSALRRNRREQSAAAARPREVEDHADAFERE